MFRPDLRTPPALLLVAFPSMFITQYCLSHRPSKYGYPKGTFSLQEHRCVLFVCNWGKKKTFKRGELCNFSVRARCTTFTNDCDIAVCYSLLVVAVTRRCKYPFPSSHLCLHIFLHWSYYSCDCTLSASSKKLTKMLWPVFKAHKRPIRHWERSVCHFWLGVERKPNRPESGPDIYAYNCVYI